MRTPSVCNRPLLLATCCLAWVGYGSKLMLQDNEGHMLLWQQQSGSEQPALLLSSNVRKTLAMMLLQSRSGSGWRARLLQSHVAHSKQLENVRNSPVVMRKMQRRSRPTESEEMADVLKAMAEKEPDVVMNEMISSPQLRVVADGGKNEDEELGVISRDEALNLADSRGEDLILISESGDVPVARIVSYDKFRYMNQKKKKEQKQKSAQLKELKVGYNIGESDFQLRKKNAVRFLTAGDRVKFSMRFKGRENSFKEAGLEIMQRMASELNDVGRIDIAPKNDGNLMVMVMVPKGK